MATAVSHKGGPNAPTWSWLWPDCCAHPGQSSCRSTLCLMTPTFVGRESGVCDTNINIPHYNPLVVIVITDGCLHGAGSTKPRGARTTSHNDDCQPWRQVLRRLGSGDGQRRRIPLGVPSHKPARRRPRHDGRSLPTRSYGSVRILPRRQSSPI